MNSCKPAQHCVDDTNIFNKARSLVIWGLALLLFAGCAEHKNDKGFITIYWDGKQATGFSVPRSLLTDFSKDSVEDLLKVRLAKIQLDMLGEYTVSEDSVVFKPMMALTHGLTYELVWRGQPLAQIEMPKVGNFANPEVNFIYPSGDSLPENLLKLYVHFTKPMQEGQAMKYITVVRNRKDTISSVFLDLDPELWNKERTTLTVWVDPGRIKRELQPNKALGPPLQNGNHYEVLIQPGWTDAEGTAIVKPFRKEFVAVKRDEASPDPGKWTIFTPKPGTRTPVIIELHEPLDHEVMIHAIAIADSKGNVLKGTIATLKGERALYFLKDQPWASGKYTLLVEPRLEDLAGNNLERVFDKDILTDTVEKKKGIYKRTFLIR
ncbi:MAG TPA: hypothetical protein VD993_00260 [Chitinophagaceae bacterium]|nr:hypothetical protein [Chitinophagaceae bacterium]